MVKITGIIHTRTGIRVVLDTGSEYLLNSKDLPVTGFSEGAVFNQEEFVHLIVICQYPRALNQAVTMLARRLYSTGEIRSRLLHAGFIPDVCDLVIYKLEKENLLNDTEFCEQWIRYRMGRKYGPSVIRRELQIKGISEDTIHSIMEKQDDSEKTQNAVLLARKFWLRIKPGEDIHRSRKKVITSLVRKGYDWDTAKSACAVAEKGK